MEIDALTKQLSEAPLEQNREKKGGKKKGKKRKRKQKEKVIKNIYSFKAVLFNTGDTEIGTETPMLLG